MFMNGYGCVLGKIGSGGRFLSEVPANAALDKFICCVDFT